MTANFDVNNSHVSIPLRLPEPPLINDSVAYLRAVRLRPDGPVVRILHLPPPYLRFGDILSRKSVPTDFGFSLRLLH